MTWGDWEDRLQPFSPRQSAQLAHRAAMRSLTVAITGLPSDLRLAALFQSLAATVSFKGIETEVNLAGRARNLGRNIRRSLDHLSPSGFVNLDPDADSALVATSAVLEAVAETGNYHGYAADAISRALEAQPDHGDAAALDHMTVATNHDISTMTAGARLLDVPLWPADNPFAAQWLAAQPILQDTPGGAFWIDWYQRALDGRLQNWPLLRDVALIDAGIWEQGGAALDHAIAMHGERHRLRDEVTRLRQELAAAQGAVATAETRDHNNPPELVNTWAEIEAQVTANLAEAEEELEKPRPSATVLTRIGDAIWTAVKYCAGLADVAAKESAKTVGGTGTKLMLGTGAAYLVGQSDAFRQLAEALIQFAGKLP